MIINNAFSVSQTRLPPLKKKSVNKKEINMMASLPITSLTLPFTLGLNAPTLFTSIALPSSLGFWKREYGVSYGYGGSILAAAYWTFQKSKEANNQIGMIHSALHMLYCSRLIVFLLYREIFIPKCPSYRIKDLVKAIDKNCKIKILKQKDQTYRIFLHKS